MLKLRNFRDNEDGFIFAIIAMIILLLVGMWFIQTVVSAIIPIAVILILIIIIAFIAKSFLRGGSFGIIRGITGATREAGRSTLGLYDSAKSEYKQRRNR